MLEPNTLDQLQKLGLPDEEISYIDSHIVGFTRDIMTELNFMCFTVNDQKTLRQFVNAWKAFPEVDRMILSCRIYEAIHGGVDGPPDSIGYACAEQLSEAFEKLLLLKHQKGASTKSPIVSARKYLFNECARYLHSQGMQISSSPRVEVSPFYEIMKTLLQDKILYELKVDDIPKHIKNTGFCPPKDS